MISGGNTSSQSPASPTPAEVPDGRLGPSPYFIASVLLTNPVFWICWAALLLNSRMAGVMFRMLEGIPTLQEMFQRLYWAQKSINLGAVALIVLGLILARTLTWFATARYELRRPYLYVRKGFLGRFRQGFFVNFTNTIPLTLIIDCDIRINLIQSFCNAGTLIVRTSDGMVTPIEFVQDAQRVRNTLLAASALKDVRVIATA